MERTLVINKINQMPDQLLGIVADFMDKLLQGYQLGVEAGGELSEMEKKELLDILLDIFEIA